MSKRKLWKGTIFKNKMQNIPPEHQSKLFKNSSNSNLFLSSIFWYFFLSIWNFSSRNHNELNLFRFKQAFTFISEFQTDWNFEREKFFKYSQQRSLMLPFSIRRVLITSSRFNFSLFFDFNFVLKVCVWEKEIDIGLCVWVNMHFYFRNFT